MCAWVLLGSGDLDLSHLKLLFFLCRDGCGHTEKSTGMGVWYGMVKSTGTGICHHKQWFRETEWHV